MHFLRKGMHWGAFVLMTGPTVSVAVPVYSVARYIERCARSLFEQTYDALEFVFIDDASPDESMEILNGLLSQYPARATAVKIVRHPVNRGLSAARNTALEHCTGEFITHVDSDDYLEPDAIEKLVALQAGTDADIVSGDFIRHNPDGEILETRPDYADREQVLLDLTEQIHRHEIWGRLIRRSLYTEHHVGPEEGCNVGEDWQTLVPLVYYARTLAHLGEPVYHYNCTNPASYMKQKWDKATAEKIARQDFRSLEIVKEFVEDKDARLYSAIKHTGRDYAHGKMDRCVWEGERSLFRFYSRCLKADRDSYDRTPVSRFADNWHLTYLLHYIVRLGLYKLRIIDSPTQ